MSGIREKFDKDGFVVIENVFNDQEIAEMKSEISKIVAEMDLSQHPRSVFSTYDEDKVLSIDLLITLSPYHSTPLTRIS